MANGQALEQGVFIQKFPGGPAPLILVISGSVGLVAHNPLNSL